MNFSHTYLIELMSDRWSLFHQIVFGLLQILVIHVVNPIPYKGLVILWKAFDLIKQLFHWIFRTKSLLAAGVDDFTQIVDFLGC